ncbi:MAG TPA: hypothetical protein DCP92_20880, partial [Nitrospiraceae bacterium]|nr:hypothetical protein [Nitrospiraceae bacterium]
HFCSIFYPQILRKNHHYIGGQGFLRLWGEGSLVILQDIIFLETICGKRIFCRSFTGTCALAIVHYAKIIRKK